MAKPLGEKSRLIREAIEANPGLGNVELATLLNGHEARKKDGLEFKAGDVANQRVALKKAKGETAGPRKATRGRKPRQAALAPVPAGKPATADGGGMVAVELVEQVFSLAKRCGGISQLKRLVDCLAER